jgi:hypothetical protein
MESKSRFRLGNLLLIRTSYIEDYIGRVGEQLCLNLRPDQGLHVEDRETKKETTIDHNE